MEYDLAIVAGFVVAYAAVSGRLARTVISGPMVYVAFGVLVGESGLGWLEFGGDTGVAEVIFEATLALLLFTDASRIDLRKVRRDVALPARLLGVGFPLTIGSGFLAQLELTDPGVFSPQGSPSIQGGVGRHPEDERRKSRLVAKSMAVAMKAEERLLGHVLGVLTITEHSHQQAEYPPLVTPDQRLERALVARLPALNQIAVRVAFPKVVAFQ